MRRPIAAATLFVSLALSAPAAMAQPAPAAEDPARVEEARNQYRNGVASFSRGRYAEATLSFERSYHLRPHPVTLYNAAEARFRSGDPTGALDQLRELLAMTSPAPDAELVGRTRTLAGQMGEPNLQPAVHATPSCPECPAAPPPRECPPAPAAERITTQIPPLAWVLAGGALVLVGVGSGLFAVASDYSSVYADPATGRSLQLHLAGDGGTYTAVGATLLVAGVGAAVGAVWMFTHPQEHHSAPTSYRPLPLDLAVGSSTIGLRGTF